jgi:hypothetical protein
MTSDRIKGAVLGATSGAGIGGLTAATIDPSHPEWLQITLIVLPIITNLLVGIFGTKRA